MQFKRTTAINKILAMTARKRVIQGGTWAGKTFGIMAVIIDYCAKHPEYKVTVVAETIPALKEGALSQFEEIMQATGRWNHHRFNKNSLTYRFANGCKLQFKSFDSVGKAKAAGKRNALFINEANHIPFNIADTLITRTTDVVWIDFNPDERFWVHDEILTQPNSEFLLLKYTDNQACPMSIVEELEHKREKAKTSKYWENWCRVYIDGEIGQLEGTIFTDWAIVDRIPYGAKYVGSGLDFGFTNDPTALVDLYEANGELWAHEVLYLTGLTNPDILTKEKLYPRMEPNEKGEMFPAGPRRIVADSAEPKSIEELRRMGMRIESVGKKDTALSIDIIRRRKLNITSSSANMIKEIRGYKYDQLKDGTMTNEPVDFNNHTMDALRYVALARLSNPNKGRYAVQ